MRYALIRDGIVSNVILLEDETQLALADGETLVQSETAGPGDSYDGKNFSAPAAVPLTWENRQSQARVLLQASDYVATRCMKVGMSYPQAWQDYDAALRAIIRAETGDATAPLPATPEKPSWP